MTGFLGALILLFVFQGSYIVPSFSSNVEYFTKQVTAKSYELASRNVKCTGKPFGTSPENIERSITYGNLTWLDKVGKTLLDLGRRRSLAEASPQEMMRAARHQQREHLAQPSSAQSSQDMTLLPHTQRRVQPSSAKI